MAAVVVAPPTATDHHLPVLDEAAERALLARFGAAATRAPGTVGSRKRRREERRDAQPCHAWRKTGECKYGAQCRFGHPPAAAAAEAAAGAGASDEEEKVAAATTTTTPPPPADVAAAAAPLSAAAAAEAAHTPHAHIDPPVGSGGVMDRYFFIRYGVDMGGQRGHDALVAVHSNKSVAMLFLSPAHPILRLGLAVARVEWGRGRDSAAREQPLTGIVTSGKSKRGQLYVHAATAVATLHTACGGAFAVRACLAAGVMEVNERLTAQPSLVTSRPRTDGYIATLFIKPDRLQALLSPLLPRAAYAGLLRLRGLEQLAGAVEQHGRDEAEATRNRVEDASEE